ncbi:uncharacterized protein [Vicugna pacos]|uniref:Uncharacterized protein isoform X2 n=1 Tax=Vicugna pacos TaxID=30538 RepID=A0ABM5C6Q5_VICPA
MQKIALCVDAGVWRLPGEGRVRAGPQPLVPPYLSASAEGQEQESEEKRSFGSLQNTVWRSWKRFGAWFHSCKATWGDSLTRAAFNISTAKSPLTRLHSKTSV